MTDSMFERGASGNTRGGLDRFLGPQGRDTSKVPDALTDGKVEERDDGSASGAQETVDCNGTDAEEPVCQIKRAIDERKADPDQLG